MYNVADEQAELAQDLCLMMKEQMKEGKQLR